MKYLSLKKILRRQSDCRLTDVKLMNSLYNKMKDDNEIHGDLNSDI